jgi:CheY-like chemotaxis protein
VSVRCDGSGTILLVEDEPSARAALAAVLRADGYVVLEAADAAEAIQTLAEQRTSRAICLVLLDIVLPVGTGLDVMHYLVAERTYIPVLAMSGSTRDLTAAAQAGADAVLFKPFDTDQLLTIAASLCQAHRRARDRLTTIPQ